MFRFHLVPRLTMCQVEDAAVLGNLFSRLSSHAQIAPLLRAYESIRYDRATATQASSRLNQRIFHLPDGLEQEERDRQMKAAMEVALNEVGEEVRRMVESTATVGATRVSAREGKDVADEGGAPAPSDGNNPNQWADKVKSRVQFGYDADADAERWWAEHGAKTIGMLADA